MHHMHRHQTKALQWQKILQLSSLGMSQTFNELQYSTRSVLELEKNSKYQSTCK
uniref:Uncharacterized protein n=1 Tax=Arundo donax TaxID=35708 RepID=A0A0A9FGB3_ARUDO